MQPVFDTIKKPITEEKSDLLYHKKKHHSSKAGSLMRLSSSKITNTKGLENIERSCSKKNNENLEQNQMIITAGGGGGYALLNKTKNMKLAPIKLVLSSAIHNNENVIPLSIDNLNQAINKLKQPRFMKPILYAHKTSQEQAKNQNHDQKGQPFLNENIEICKPIELDCNSITQQKYKSIEELKNNDVTSTPRKNSNKKKENFINEIKGSIIKWKTGDFIGAGKFGQVFRAMEFESGKIIAVKKIPFANGVNNENLRALENELLMLQKLRHKNIVEYIGHERIANDLYIYLEYISGGSIQSILAKFGPLPEQTIKIYARQILIGLDFLHSQKVIHKDIKGANILVDAEGKVKLADFGCAGELEKTLSNMEDIISETLKGSVPWMAPEVVKQTKYSRRSDIWSFGCTMLEMATGKVPWAEFKFENHIALLMKIALSDDIPTIPDSIGPNLKDFIKICLQRDSSNRPYAKDLLKHEFLNSS